MLDKLAEVQVLDLKLDGLSDERAQVPPELISTQAKRKQLEEIISVREADSSELRKRINANELELKALQERRRAAADAAVRAGSAKEASQYQNQELQFATRVTELEEDTMPLLEAQEALDSEIANLKAELSELIPVLDELVATELARVEGVDARGVSLAAERQELASTIAAPLLQQYEQVRKARRGVGLAELVANASCGGCNMRLPIHVVQKVKRNEGVTRCPSCGRLLYAKQASA